MRIKLFELFVYIRLEHTEHNPVTIFALIQRRQKEPVRAFKSATDEQKLLKNSLFFTPSLSISLQMLSSVGISNFLPLVRK